MSECAPAPLSSLAALRARLSPHTPARVALGLAGVSLPTQAHLDFQLDHARARDAVHHPLDVEALAERFTAMGRAVLRVESAAGDRARYLRRPDLGRRLDAASAILLQERTPCDVAIVAADGLCAHGVEAGAAPLVRALAPALEAEGLVVGPVVIARQARVAIGDEIGERLRARLVLVLIGERPGLSSFDSLGAYLTFDPKVGRTDAERNCLSNIRPAGLSTADATRRLFSLIMAARRARMTGVALKEDGGALAP